jgi:N-acetylmuramoyl-L-alanine amidase
MRRSDARRRRVWWVTLSLAGVAALTVPLRSQQAGQIAGAAISQAQNPGTGAPPQNATPATPAGNATQAPGPAASEEAAGVTVVLDPAHGGADFGSRGHTGLAESDVVLDFARAARIALEAQRLRVLLTREGNQDPGFDNRSANINGLRNAVFVSLHVSSGGPVGTARTYYYAFPSGAASLVTPTASATAAPSATVSGQPSGPQAGPRSGLVEWDRAQRASVELSRQLAGLAQAELVRRFKGSPEMPVAAPVRQLRTIAAPAIAIELSSINVTDAKRLDQMAQPLAEAIGKAVSEFHFPGNAPAAATNGGY